MKIVADDAIPFLKGVFEPFCDVVFVPGSRIDRASLRDATTLIIRSLTHCNASLLDGTSVRFIATATIGDDHIDKDYCRKNDIRWVNAKGCNADAVAQYVTAALLYIANKSHLELAGKRLGIIGVGNIGSRMERISRILGMEPLLYDPPRALTERSVPFVSLEEIQKKSEFLTLHVPLTRGGQDKTEHMFDEDFFAGLGERSFLINTARGSVVKTEAVKKAMKKGQLSQIVFDVWENEPDIDRSLAHGALLATPHIAGYSVEGKYKGTSMVVKAVADFAGIKPVPEIPQKIPLPEIISPICKNKKSVDLLGEIYSKICPLSRETQLMKEKPEKFLELRENYNLRRDNSGIHLNLTKCYPPPELPLKDLEFKGVES